MTKLKICGLKRSEDIAFANELKPDYVGFVFADGSRRRVTEEAAAGFRKALLSDIPAVGVFVNQKTDFIIRLVKKGIVQMVQLHGDETEEEIRQIREQTGCPVIKAVRVPDCEDIMEAEKGSADFLLLDGGAGDGKTFPWEKIPKNLKKPYFLAGGITAENAGAAVRMTNAFALDASSSVETNGIKDYEKMKELIRRVHDL